MVATRRGVRVYSPSKTNPERSSDVQATPSTGRRTRSTAKQAESATQNALVETCSQLEKSEGKHLASTPTCLMKRCTRASRLHSPEQPCTPVGSTHEGDISDMESCCSVVSDIEPPVTRTRARRRQPRTVSQEDEIYEVESCSSAVSASRAGRSSRRNTRRKIIPESSDPASVEAEDAKVDLVLEAESCSSVVSESKRVTRSQRKTARTRSSAKQQIEDSELSDTDSYLSSVSGADVSESTSRRVARSRRQTGPIPIHLDEASESSLSPAPTRRSTRAAKGKTAATIDVCEAQSCDSEGFESGPTYSKTNRRQEMAKPGPGLGSDSELTDMHSPVGSPRSTRSRGTPCSSRTGSGSSRQGAPATRHSVKALSVALKEGVEDISFNDSRLESTVIAEDADQTLLEEKKEKDGVKSADPTSNETDALKVEKGVSVVLEEDSHVSDSPEEAVSKPAVTASYQQEELCDENKAGDTSEMEVMQETVPSSEQLNPCQSVTAALCERTSETTEETEAEDEAMEAVDVDAHPSQEEEAVDEGVVEKTSSSEEEKMEVSTLNSDAEQVVDSSEVHVESIQVTSSQQHNITVYSGPEQQPKDVTVQNKTFISLLESSEDEEDEEEEEKEVSEEEGEEDLGCVAEERGGPSNTSEAAGSSADGLFMIDKRPGQEADEYYYMEKPKEEEEEEEEKATKDEEESAEQEEQDEFVDEEGDDDDEEANILFLSKNPQLKEMSSRIDPGIRLKELGGLYINFDGSKSKPVSSSLQKLKEKKIQEEVMKKSVIGPDFAKKDAVPPYSESKQALKLKHRVEREKSTGDGWFNMKAPEISQELKGDLQVLKMRGSLDPKRFYKKNDRDGFPKYFQVGTVVDNPVDFYHSRVPKKDRKRTMVEELLADAEFRHNNKKKYQQIVAEKAAQGAGRRNKKKNKFHKK